MPTILYLTTIIVVFSIPSSSSSDPSSVLPRPSRCLTETTVDGCVKCLSYLFKQKREVSFEDWLKWRPTDPERTAMAQVLQDLLEQKDFCENISIPVEINNIIFVKRFEAEGKKYCLLTESKTIQIPTGRTRFARGWGFFMTPEKGEAIERPHLHFSAAHPFYDGDVHKQAPHVFAAVGAKSVVVAGAHRHTVWDTANLAPCDGKYHVMDPSHSTEVMFHTMLMAVRRWQFGDVVNQTKCQFNNDKNSCLFVQFHGMGTSTSSCSNDTMLMSVGAYGSTGRRIYEDPNSGINVISRQIVNQAAKHELAWKPHNPLVTACPLAGSKNPFGRVLNGVEPTRACAVGANAGSDGVSGSFIHVEQKREARDSKNPVAFQIWDDVFRAVLA